MPLLGKQVCARHAGSSFALGPSLSTEKAQPSLAVKVDGISFVSWPSSCLFNRYSNLKQSFFSLPLLFGNEQDLTTGARLCIGLELTEGVVSLKAKSDLKRGVWLWVIGETFHLDPTPKLKELEEVRFMRSLPLVEPPLELGIEEVLLFK